MIPKINQEEIELIECLLNPVSATECLFTDLENMTYDWDKPDQFAHIRQGQLPMLSYEHMLDYENPDLSPKQNFQLQINAGKIDCYSGRNLGKTHLVEVLDILLCAIWLDYEAGFTSCDAIHIRAVLEDKLIPVIEKHPLFSNLLKGINRSPSYKIAFKSGFRLLGINQNAFSKNPGSQFLGKHLKRLYSEEASMLLEEVANKAQEAKSDQGILIRSAGMTDFTRFSPSGKSFYDPENQPWVCNLPIYINPNYQEKEEEEALKKYSGKASYFYRTYCKAEIVEDAITVIDFARIKGCYIEDKFIKQFEVNKKNFHNFKDIIIIDRYEGIEEVWIGSDIGFTAATEIMIFFKNDDIFKYQYRVTLYNLTDKEQFEIFQFIINKLKANVCALDTTEAGSRAIMRQLEEYYPKENLLSVGFNEKIKVDFKRDDNGNPIYDEKGMIQYQEEYVAEWSIKVMKDLLYDHKIRMPMDYILTKQLNGLICFKSGNRLIYEVKGGEDHAISALRVFSIAYFQNQFKQMQGMTPSKKFSKSGV